MVYSLKKAFSVFVTLTTILWSVGAGALAFPSAASAATLNTGDLIKASGPAVYYYAADGKRYVFPHEKMFYSWFKDFSSVKTITDGELAAISIGGNVTERPGTMMVKIQTDPKTYAVTLGGVLHWIQSEDIAKALYGTNWNQRIIDVSDAFFVNYTVGSSVSTNVHPDGTLITYAGDPTVYVVWSGVKRKFAAGAFDANGYNAANVITTTIVYGNGSDVTGRESNLADVIVTSGGPVVGGALTASLASDTPAGMNVPKNASSVPLVKVNFSAGSSDVAISGLKFHRIGVGSVSDFSNVYLYDQDGLRITTGRTINSTSNMVEFNSLNLTVKAGTTISVYVYGDFSTPSTTGGQHAFELADAASIVVGAGTVSGSFPIRGNTFTVGTTSSARVDVIKGSQPSNPTIGTKQAEISNFKLQTNGVNDVEVRQITLYQAGGVTNSDITNLNLYVGSTLVATAATISSNGRIVLKFSPAYVIPNGQTRVFSLKADVAGRASRTIKTYVEYTTDVTAIDKTFNAGAQICIISTATGCTAGTANFDGTGGSGTSPQTNGNFMEVLTQGGQLTNAFNGPATTNVAKGQLGVPLYKFTLTSADNALEIKKIVFTLQKVTGTPTICSLRGAASTPTAYFRSIKIKNLDTGATLMGPQELSGTGSTSTQNLTYTDSFNINAGQSLNLAFVADLSNTEDTAGDFFTNGNCQYQAVFNAFGSSDIRVVDTGEFLATDKIVPNTNVTGNAMTVKSSSLSVALASNPVTGTLVKKSANVPIAGITLTASAQSDITITSLTLSGQATTTSAWSAANFATRVTSLSLSDGGTQVGLAKAPDTTLGTAQISNMNLVIPKGTTKTLTILATLSSSADTAFNDAISVGIAANSGSTSQIQAQDQDSNTVTPTISSVLNTGTNGQLTTTPSVKQTILNSGTITLQSESQPVTNIVIAGKDAWVPMAQYKLTSQYEALNVDRVQVLASSTAGTGDNADYMAVAIASGGAVKGQDTLSAGSTGSRDIDLSTNNLVVPKDASVTFQIWAKFNPTTASSTVSGATTTVARSGHTPAIGVNTSTQTGEWDSNYSGKFNIRATGAASGERVYTAFVAGTMGNVQVLRKSVPIVTKQSLSSTTLSNIDQDLIKFQIAADSAGSIAWKQVTFSYSKTSLVALTNFRLRKGSVDLDTSTYAITSSTNAADLVSGSLSVGNNSGQIIVAFKPGFEESISGSGSVYTLHATVSGAASGQSVTFTFVRETSTTVVTGYLANFGLGASATGTNNYVIDTGVAPAAAADASSTAMFAGTFVWSDNSENPHSPALGNATAGGSRDWSNDLYVQDLTQSQTLSL